MDNKDKEFVKFFLIMGFSGVAMCLTLFAGTLFLVNIFT